MSRRAVVALGIGQCVNWGVLYYAFGVLLLPLARELRVPAWVVAGAFSTALLASAAAAPTIGRWSDRGYGPRLIRSGGLAAAGLLLLWALVPGLPTLYAVWATIGLCMAATLYEPVFIIVGRASPDPVERLRALATVTVFGGLASTVFLPATALLIESLGWRWAVVVLGLTLAASSYATSRAAFGAAVVVNAGLDVEPAASPSMDPRFRIVLALFSTASLTSAAFTTMVVPALVARQMAPAEASMLGGMLGLMQLPGRALLMGGGLRMSPSRLLVVGLALQAIGLAALVAARAPLPVGCGVALFALGAGLLTLVRPHLVQTAFGSEGVGRLNGLLARSQQLARAAGPVMSVGLAGLVGYGAVFGLLAAVLATLAVISHVHLDI